MICEACNAENIEDAQFCSACGERIYPPLTGARASEVTPVRVAPAPSKPKTSTGQWIAIGIGALIFCMSIAGKMSRPVSTPPQPALINIEEMNGATKARFERIQIGMSYDECVDVLRQGGDEMSRSAIGGTTSVMYQWHGADGHGVMNAIFENGKLVSKVQAGLN